MLNQEDVDKLIEHIKNISPEEYNKELLCLNGTMTEELLSKVLSEVIRVGNIDVEDIQYNPEQYRISSEEFMDVYHYIDQKIIERYPVINSYFPEVKICFIYNSTHFVWRLLQGQGSCCQLYTDNEEEYLEFPGVIDILVSDPSIRFYKRT